MTFMPREAGLLRPPLTPTPAPQPLNYMARRGRRAGNSALKFCDRYFTALCLCFLGYAVAGRGFAYLGVNPLFIGEVMLMVGVVALLRCGSLKVVLSIRSFIPMFLFIVLGAARTIPFLDVYGKDAIRDAVTWGYAAFAVIVAGMLVSSPTRVQKIITYGRRYVVIFLLLGPVTSLISSFFLEYIPFIPGTDVQIIYVKGGDMCVHLGGCFAFIVALGSGMNVWIPSLFVPLNVGLNISGRAGMVAFTVAAFITMVLRPFAARAMRIFFVMGLGLFAMWAFDVRIEHGARELSFQQLVKGFSSIVGDSDEEALSGSKEWRINWWTDIYNYTFKGKYFWTGKGFGVNLATEDGFQVDEAQTLRSPHNGHMTMLARGGVPGLTIWILLQLTWGTVVFKSYLRARRYRHENWSGMFLFLGAYWAAFVANASFDVFLEGPMGGIPFWCIYGAGIACTYIYPRHPDLLTPPPQPARGFHAVLQSPVESI